MSIESRIAALEEFVGTGRLFGGVTMGDVARSGYLAGKGGKIGYVSGGTKRYCAMQGMGVVLTLMQRPERYRRAGADQAVVDAAQAKADRLREKYGLPDLVDTEGIMARFIGFAVDGGFSPDELAELREKITRQLALETRVSTLSHGTPQ
jgi:hypothetical protein